MEKIKGYMVAIRNKLPSSCGKPDMTLIKEKLSDCRPKNLPKFPALPSVSVPQPLLNLCHTFGYYHDKVLGACVTKGSSNEETLPSAPLSRNLNILILSLTVLAWSSSTFYSYIALTPSK